MTTRRGGPGTEEQPVVRFASRIIRMQVEVLRDPIWGEPIAGTGFWQRAVLALEDDDEMQPMGNLLRAHIERAGNVIPDWRIEQQKMTLTEEGVKAIGITPHAYAFGDDPAFAEPAPEGDPDESILEDEDTGEEISSESGDDENPFPGPPEEPEEDE
jgi:hypothetical protein